MRDGRRRVATSYGRTRCCRAGRTGGPRLTFAGVCTPAVAGRDSTKCGFLRRGQHSGRACHRHVRRPVSRVGSCRVSRHDLVVMGGSGDVWCLRSRPLIASVRFPVASPLSEWLGIPWPTGDLVVALAMPSCSSFARRWSLRRRTAKLRAVRDVDPTAAPGSRRL